MGSQPRAGPRSPCLSLPLQGPAGCWAERTEGVHGPPPAPAMPAPPDLRTGTQGWPASPQPSAILTRGVQRQLQDRDPREPWSLKAGRLKGPWGPRAAHCASPHPPQTWLQEAPASDALLLLSRVGISRPGPSWLLRSRAAGAAAQPSREVQPLSPSCALSSCWGTVVGCPVPSLPPSSPPGASPAALRPT